MRAQNRGAVRSVVTEKDIDLDELTDVDITDMGAYFSDVQLVGDYEGVPDVEFNMDSSSSQEEA